MKSKRITLGKHNTINLGLLSNGCIYVWPALSFQYSKSESMIKRKYYFSIDLEWFNFTTYISFNWSKTK